MSGEEWVKVFIAIGGFALSLQAAYAAIRKSHEDRNKALEQQRLAVEQQEKALQQAKDDLRWRQTVEAQKAIERMGDSAPAQWAMNMLDWNGLSFEVRPGQRERVTWQDLREALRVERLAFAPKERFVRDSFDALFNQFQLMQQQLANKMFALEDVLYPIAYYARRIKHPVNWPTFERFLTTYDYARARSLIDDAFAESRASGEDYLKDEAEPESEAAKQKFEGRFCVEETD